MSGVSHGPLGESVSYPSAYAPELLHPIARAPGRAGLGLAQAMFGVDEWTAYELSWLNAKGKPMVACAVFRFPAHSSHIIESKSFKLYLNSFNQHRLDSPAALVATLKGDLSARVDTAVEVELLLPDRWAQLQPSAAPVGVCLDGLDVTPQAYLPEEALLTVAGSGVVDERLYSNLLRSRCPVTGQPDWASVVIDYRGAPIAREALLLYLISFREHDDFHEHCVERIYRDIQRHCRPQALTVSARYLRRGGLDINPWRSSDPGRVVPTERLLRQ